MALAEQGEGAAMSLSFPSLSTEWEDLFARPEQIDAYLVALFDSWESAPAPIKFDRFIGLGFRFAREGREDKDSVVLHWLAQNPTPRRLDIVCAFLSGLWNAVVRKKPVSADQVQTLIRLRSRVPFEDESAASCALALSRVAESAPPEISANALSAMGSIAREDFRSPEMETQVRELLVLVRQRRSNANRPRPN